MRKTKSTEQVAILAKNDSSEKSKDLYIIGIGASAGGLEALQDLISSLPSKLDGCAIIIAQHLSPTHKSMLVQLLSRNTGIQVKEAIHNMPISEGTIYITPPDKDIVVRGKLIELHKPYFVSGPKPSVDILFQSLAKNIGDKAIGVILSGTGSDGAKGIVAIKEAGGLTIVQNPDTAKYNGMPNAAIESGIVDVILSPDLIGPELVEYIADPNLPRIHPVQEVSNVQTPLGRIFAVLSKRAGIDFSNYKPATICRRLEKRIVELKKDSLEEYVNYLEQNDPEASILFNSILIGVTTFFRDEAAFEVLNQHLEKLLLSKKNLTPLRIWVPGCATGEEAYSIAILVQEIMKQKGGKFHVQIFATDIDEQAIQQARKGVYPYSSVEHVPQEIKESYFLKRNDQYELIKSVRSMVLFSRHDVTSNPPFLKLDLISCRNLLIYFGNNLQKQIMPLFHYALLPDGYLFLGKSESVGQFSDLFAALDHKAKLFQRKIGNALHAIKFNAFRPQRIHEIPQESRNLPSPNPTTIQDVVKEAIFDQFDYPYIVLSESFDVVEVRGDVSHFVQIPQGTMNVGILKLIKEEYQIELRSMLNKVVKTRQTEKGTIRKMKLTGSEIMMRMSVRSVQGEVGFAQMLLLIFEMFELDSKSLSLFDGLLTKEVETSIVLQLEQELSSTKEHLQTYIEELETTNEELQSLNEEMQSTNEELQSSNEELETTNEELQSSNEEIQIAYTELKIANEELELKEIALEENKANVHALLNNSLQAFFLVDHEYKIIKFNEQAENLILRLSGKTCKVGHLIIDYLPSKSLDEFLSQFKKALVEEIINVEMSLNTVDRIVLSHFKICFNTVYHTRLQRKLMTIGMLDVTEEKNAKDELIKNQLLTNSVFNAAAFGVCVTNAFGYFVDFNQEYTKIYGYEREELIGKHFSIVVPDQFKRQATKMHDDFIKDGFELPAEWEVIRKDGTPISIYVKAELLVQPDGSRFKVTSIRDISDVKGLLDRIAQSHELAQVGSWEYILETQEYVLSPELKKMLEIDESISVLTRDVGDSFLKGDNYIELFRNSMEDLILRDIDFDIEFKIVTQSGQVKWMHAIAVKKINDNGDVIRVIGVSNDITKYKEASEKLEIFSHTIQQSTRGIIILSEEKKITFANPAAVNLFGFPEQELLDSSIWMLLKDTPNNAEGIKKLKLCLDQGRSCSERLNVQSGQGKQIVVLVNMSSLLDVNNHSKYFVCFFEDITADVEKEKNELIEKKKMQKLMTDAIIEAQEKERHEIGLELHDNVNQLLVSLKMFLNFANHDPQSLEKAKEIVNETIAEVRRLSHSMVLPIVANSNFNEIVDNIVFELKASSDLSVYKQVIGLNEFTLPPQLKLNIYRVLQILISNVIKHASATEIKIKITNSEDLIILVVEDNGKGFDPNAKTDGIGLLNIKTRSSLFDGSVDIDSAPGQGTRITVKMKKAV